MIDSDVSEVLKRLDTLGITPYFNGSRVVITGARGFLGRAFTRVLAECGAVVFALDKFSLSAEMGAALPFSHPRVEWVDHDVLRPFPIHGQVDFVLSLAAIASPVHYARRPLDCNDVIVQGTRNMLDLAMMKGATMLLSSTSELYGDPIVVPTPEHAIGRLNPWDVRGKAYDVPKLAAEALTSIYADRGVKVQTVRYFNVFGAGMARGDYRVMTRFAASVVDGKAITVHGYGHQTRSFCYLTDALIGTLLALVKGDGKPYNVGNAALEVSMRDLAAVFAKLGSVPVEYVTAPEAYEKQPQRRCPDLSRIEGLGYQPTVGLEDGVKRMLDWAKEAYR